MVGTSYHIVSYCIVDISSSRVTHSLIYIYIYIYNYQVYVRMNERETLQYYCRWLLEKKEWIRETQKEWRKEISFLFFVLVLVIHVFCSYPSWRQYSTRSGVPIFYCSNLADSYEQKQYVCSGNVLQYNLLLHCWSIIIQYANQICYGGDPVTVAHTNST